VAAFDLLVVRRPCRSSYVHINLPMAVVQPGRVAPTRSRLRAGSIGGRCVLGADRFGRYAGPYHAHCHWSGLAGLPVPPAPDRCAGRRIPAYSPRMGDDTHKLRMPRSRSGRGIPLKMEAFPFRIRSGAHVHQRLRQLNRTNPRSAVVDGCPDCPHPIVDFWYGRNGSFCGGWPWLEPLRTVHDRSRHSTGYVPSYP